MPLQGTIKFRTLAAPNQQPYVNYSYTVKQGIRGTAGGG